MARYDAQHFKPESFYQQSTYGSLVNENVFSSRLPEDVFQNQDATDKQKLVSYDYLTTKQTVFYGDNDSYGYRTFSQYVKDGVTPPKFLLLHNIPIFDNAYLLRTMTKDLGSSSEVSITLNGGSGNLLVDGNAYNSRYLLIEMQGGGGGGCGGYGEYDNNSLGGPSGASGAYTRFIVARHRISSIQLKISAYSGAGGVAIDSDDNVTADKQTACAGKPGADCSATITYLDATNTNKTVKITAEGGDGGNYNWSETDKEKIVGKIAIGGGISTTGTLDWYSGTNFLFQVGGSSGSAGTYAYGKSLKGNSGKELSFAGYSGAIDKTGILLYPSISKFTNDGGSGTTVLSNKNRFAGGAGGAASYSSVGTSAGHDSGSNNPGYGAGGCGGCAYWNGLGSLNSYYNGGAGGKPFIRIYLCDKK